MVMDIRSIVATREVEASMALRAALLLLIVIRCVLSVIARLRELVRYLRHNLVFIESLDSGNYCVGFYD